jgi:hypothetical protein
VPLLAELNDVLYIRDVCLVGTQPLLSQMAGWRRAPHSRPRTKIVSRKSNILLSSSDLGKNSHLFFVPAPIPHRPGQDISPASVPKSARQQNAPAFCNSKHASFIRSSPNRAPIPRTEGLMHS